jgi:hypothetical protein
MSKTGESFATARRQVLKSAPSDHSHSAPYLHFPGNIPSSTALRILLANEGVRAPHSGAPFSEAMVFGIAGGIGAGVFAFRYEKEDISTFFIAGRHLWQDDLEYLEKAAARFGARVEARETGGVKKAAVDLHELLTKNRAVIAWVDQGSLPYRSMPDMWGGGGYHVITVYGIDEASSHAAIGDLTAAPIDLDLDSLAQARARIKKQKNRLFSISAGEVTDLETLVVKGLQACVEGLTKGRSSSFTLESFAKLSDDLTKGGKDGWPQKFPRGHNLWRGLTSMYDFIEHYGTGGGLFRPIFSDFLEEASEALADEGLSKLAQDYAELGEGWTELGRTALPDSGPLGRARVLLDRKADGYFVHAESGAEEYSKVWQELESLEKEVDENFPLGEAEVSDLLGKLSERVEDLHQREAEALSELVRVAKRLAG